MYSRKLVAVISAVVLLPSLSLAADAPRPAAAAGAFAFAVIGDVPYGSTQIAEFPRQVDQINADPDVQVASHLGDISSPLNCTDSYFNTVKSQFDRFTDPLVYTPGDNEWADCHRASVGPANPLNRLDAVRRIFYPDPGTTLGANKIGVSEQSGYPENVLFERGGLTFAAVHIVGSNNDLNAWTGLGYSSPTTAQKAEVTARTNADITLIRDAFSRARSTESRAVVLTTQADMFAPGADGSTYRTAYKSLVQTIAAESLSFVKPVFLINGDTHAWASDKPLMSSSWRSFYSVGSSVPNLSRITVRGGTWEWTKLTVVPDATVLKVQRVPLGATAPANSAPTAAFTSSVSALTASVNGSGSTDSDGSISSHAWTFGDGATETGATASHTYAAAGSYQVSLTVTDNGGATGTVSHTVTVSGATTPPPPPPTGSALAQDSFTRTVSGGLGSAEIGGPWTTSGTASHFSVTGAAAAVTSPAGSNRFGYLDGVSSSDTEVRAVLAFPKPSASSIYAGLIGRRVGSASYGARVVVASSGAVKLQLQRSTGTVLQGVTLSGLTYASGDRLQFRVQVTGTAPTTIRARVWKVGATEPTTWQVTATDSTSGLQSAGGIGIYNYLSGSASPTSLVVTYDDLWAGPSTSTPTPAPNSAPTAAFTSSASALTASVNGAGSTDADGTIASYAWTFGDGATATGVTASHTYAAAGTYQVTLTVTDNAGATGTVGHALTVSEVTPPPPPAGSPLAQDSFTRTVSNGLGSAEIGGAWTTSGTAANFAVDGGAAAVTSPAGSNRFAYLDGVSSSDTEVSATVSFTRPTASSIYAGLIGRRVGAATYGARVVVDANGSVKLQLQRSTNTVLLSTTVPGLTYLSGDRLQLRVQVTGLSPTTIRATVWKVGTTEPVAWQLTATDSTAALQSAGGIGLYNYLSGSASPTSLVVSFDDLRAGPTG